MMGNHTRRSLSLKNTANNKKKISNTRKNKLNNNNLKKNEEMMINTFKSKFQLKPLPRVFKNPGVSDEYIRRLNEPIVFKKNN
jgi:hypothetical protein